MKLHQAVGWVRLIESTMIDPVRQWMFIFVEKLTPGERVVQEAKFEIITSEASYLNSLEVLKREFIEDEGLKRILTDKQKDNIFGEVLNILSLSDKFLNDLESIWQKDPMMSGLLDVCLKHSTNWNMSYINYCYNQIETDITLKELRFGFLFVLII